MGQCVTVEFGVDLTTMSCGQCGGTYAISEKYRANRQRDGDGWHCPYCQCSWGYFGNGQVEKLKEKLAEQERKTELERKRKEWAQTEAEHAERRRRGEKAAKTRIKNRIAKGVCPCCNRTFGNLQQHMASKHPDFSESA